MRVIPGVTADTHAHVLTGHEGSKFGLLPADAAPLIARIERAPRLRMRGLHVHVGSQILDVEPFADSVAPVAALGEFEVYDLGGGLGARYTYADQPPSVAAYLDALIGAAREHLPAEAEIIIEPGRSMVASNAATLYRVVTLKRQFVAVDGGMGDNLEVALFDQRFEAGIADRLGGGERYTLVGRHCESGDVLVDGVELDARASATSSRCRRPAPTATRWPTTTTAPAASRWSSRATARPASWCAARPGTTCSRATSILRVRPLNIAKPAAEPKQC